MIKSEPRKLTSFHRVKTILILDVIKIKFFLKKATGYIVITTEGPVEALKQMKLKKNMCNVLGEKKYKFKV